MPSIGLSNLSKIRQDDASCDHVHHGLTYDDDIDSVHMSLRLRLSEKSCDDVNPIQDAASCDTDITGHERLVRYDRMMLAKMKIGIDISAFTYL